MIYSWLLPLIFVAVLPPYEEYPVCECCTYSSLQHEKNYDKVFLPELVKSNNIHEATVYTTSMRISKNAKGVVSKNTGKEYREMILKFNKDGFVEAQVVFNQLGRYHSINEFKRDADNRIVSKTFYYLDSLGVKDELMVDRWVYTYANGRLSKVKKMGVKLVEQPDKVSDYESYQYDSKGRIVAEIHQMHFSGPDDSYMKTRTTYDDAMNTSLAVTEAKGKTFSFVRTNYTSTGKILKYKFYDGRTNKLLSEENHAYNSDGQLVKFQTKSLGMFTECPDGGTSDDTYTYSSLKLLAGISHHYENTFCNMRVAYK